MRIGADERVRIGDPLAADLLAEHDAREVLQIHLVDDSGVGRDDPEILERGLAPPKKRVSLLVAHELELRVQLEGVPFGEVIDLHGMIDDEFDGLQRVHFLRIAAEPDDAVAHRSEIDDGRHAGEVLQQDTRRHERNLFLRLRRDVPLRERLNVVAVDEAAILPAQEIFEQDPQ